MLLGPVFQLELRAIAHRKRTFLIRGTYGLLLLFAFCIPLVDSGLSSAGELAPHDLARLAEAFWISIMVAQALAILILTPALVAGALAEERERGNLDLLAASPLSGIEIILGKLAARLSDLVAIIAVAVPVLCILSLMGGVDVGLMILSDGVMLATAFLLAAMAIAVSIFSARPARAITATYLLVAGWIALLYLLGQPNPLYVFALRNPHATLLVATMGVQVALGMALLLGSAVVLRPLIRGAGPFGWRVPPISFLMNRRRLWPRPSCGDNPMVWKECLVGRTTLLFRLAAALGVLAIAYPLAEVTWRYAAPAFEELRAQGYGSGGVSVLREQLNEFLRVTLVILYILMGLGLAARSATSITAEKEKGTWSSLLATPLDVGEIVGAKVLGALWGMRWPGLLHAAYLALGLATGAIHPLAGVYSILLTAACLGFVAALGITVSMRSRSSVRALAVTLGALLALNTLPNCCGVLSFESTPLPFVFVSPILLVLGLASYDDVDRFFREETLMHTGISSTGIAVILVFGLIFHAATAMALLGSCIAHFEIEADRPRRDNPMKRRRPHR